MIPRYTRPQMARVWEPRNKFEVWLRIEKLVCHALADLGRIPLEAARAIEKKARFSLERIEEIEKTTKHDVIAFLTAVGETVGDEARYLHLGLTSSDILDTGFALQLKEASDLILAGIDRLLQVIEHKAWQYKDTPMIGRTHGVHAEPVTFGFKLTVWYEETRRNRTRMERAKEAISVGKISGAVGTYAHTPPEVEEYVCSRLGLRPASVSTQILQRDRHAEFFTTLAVIASSIEKYATEIRHLQRTEVAEAEEFFSEGQKGSSAMPHKRNPIGSENLCGLARLVRANALAALENVALWHERDISHSSVERVIGPDSTILVDYMLHRIADLLENLVVYPDRMLENLRLTGGAIYSQDLMLRLVDKGLSREEAYRVIQRIAHQSRGPEGGKAFEAALRNDPVVGRHLSAEEIEEILSFESHLKFIDTIYERVYGRPASGHNTGRAETAAVSAPSSPRPTAPRRTSPAGQAQKRQKR
jgi:adenylosuccinate lyase